MANTETKEILIKKIKNLQDGIEYRDKKISELMEESEEKLNTIKTLKEDIRYNKENSKFVEEVKNVKQEYEEKIRDLKVAHQEKHRELDVILNTILKEHKTTVDRYESLLRVLQGSLDAHLELSDLSNKSIDKYYSKEK